MSLDMDSMNEEIKWFVRQLLQTQHEGKRQRETCETVEENLLV